jgi:hypothetical protein
MNQTSVESIAQSILAMSDEERQQLEAQLDQLKTANIASLISELASDSSASKSFRVAEVARDIQAFEEKYYLPSYPLDYRAVLDQPSVTGSSGLEANSEYEKTAYSFFKQARSLNIEGPQDGSINVDHYLYGLPKVQDD